MVFCFGCFVLVCGDDVCVWFVWFGMGVVGVIGVMGEVCVVWDGLVEWVGGWC